MQDTNNFLKARKSDKARASRLMPLTDRENLESIEISHHYHQFHPSDEAYDDEHVIQIKGDDGSLYRACTKSNSSIIDGVQKSRKSMLINLFVSCVLSNKPIDNKLIPTEGDQGLILYIDTEQASNDIAKVFYRIKKKTGMSESDIMDRLKIYQLAGKSPEEKENAMLAFIEIHTRPISLIIIDGIADIYPQFNNEDISTLACSAIDNIKYDYNCHVMTVLHQSKGSNFSKGHLGALLTNKAETNFKMAIDKAGDFSTVQAGNTRGLAFEDFAISYDDDKGQVYIMDDFEPSVKIKEIKVRFEDLKDGFHDDIHYKILKQVFLSKDRLSRAELGQQLKAALESNGLAGGNNHQGYALSHYVEKNWIKVHKGSSNEYSFDEANLKLNGTNYNAKEATL